MVTTVVGVGLVSVFDKECSLLVGIIVDEDMLDFPLVRISVVKDTKFE